MKISKKSLMALLASAGKKKSSGSNRIKCNGEAVIIRATKAGVHFGYIESYKGQEVVLKNSRRIWRYVALSGVSLSGVAVFGNDNSDSRSKIEPPVSRITILDACEIIHITKASEKTLVEAENSVKS